MKKIKDEIKTGKDGFVRHKPCFYTQIMKEEQEAVELYGKEMKRLYQEKLDIPEWKEVCRFFINDTEKRYNKAKRTLERYCVGVSSCPAL